MNRTDVEGGYPVSYIMVMFLSLIVYIPIAFIIVLAIYALLLSIKALKIYIAKNS